jgi:hypothetical protein
LDDVRIYNRLLTINDVQALYFLAGQPKLSLSYSGTTLVLSWPAAAYGFHLQQNSALADTGSVWSNVSGTPALSADGATQSVTIAIGNQPQFYRLANP